jgi:hypothetical protein
VVRKYRRPGVGTRAAQHVFRRYLGRWEVPVAGYNEGALLFWRAPVRSMAQVTEAPGARAPSGADRAAACGGRQIPVGGGLVAGVVWPGGMIRPSNAGGGQ